MDLSYENLPLVELKAPKVESGRTAGMATEETLKQDQEDAEKVMCRVGLEPDVCLWDKFEPGEKYLIETAPGEAQKNTGVGMRQGGLRKPHYTRLFVLENKMVFQAACCLPLKVIAASLDSNNVSGRVLYRSHSENEGGKLIYELMGKGSELIIDVKRGDSTRAQRLIFRI